MNCLVLQDGIKQASALEPRVQEFFHSSRKLQDDSNLSEVNRKIVRQGSGSLKQRWDKIKGDLSSREAR